MTDITELAQSLKAAAEKATPGNWRAFQYHDGRCGVGGGNHDEIMVCEHISKKRPHDAEFIALANPANVRALVEAQEKAQQRIGKLETYSITALEFREAARDENRRLKVDLDIAEKRIAELESRTVTDWIEHDGKWRPDSLSTDELVYLKTRKQELKIPYPAGKVLGWMHTGGDMDVMAYKLASPQARTVTVKLPELCVGVVQDGHAVMVPYPAGHWFNKTAILEMLADAGIKVEAE
ncbi:ead/Ea22-like family protein [Klebsiella quasipneumoniae]|uniref:ead/Ea22-like family protein n=1 Tax=Klebsiella quasipneumoniae TaxID=1463165 RepID=UPI003A86FB7C